MDFVLFILSSHVDSLKGHYRKFFFVQRLHGGVGACTNAVDVGQAGLFHNKNKLCICSTDTTLLTLFCIHIVMASLGLIIAFFFYCCSCCISDNAPFKVINSS